MKLYFVVNEIGFYNYIRPYLKTLDELKIEYSTSVSEKVRRHIERAKSDNHWIVSTFNSGGDKTLIDDLTASVCILSASAANQEKLVIEKCRSLCIPTFSVIDMWVNYKWRFVFDNHMVLPENILLPDDIALEEAVNDGLPIEKLRVVGHPVFEEISPAVEGARSAIFLDQPAPRDCSSKDAFQMDTSWQFVLSFFETMPCPFDELIFCPHPEKHLSNVGVPNHVRVVQFWDLNHSDYQYVFGVSSTAMVESYLRGKVVFSVQPISTKVNSDPLSRHGKIKKITSKEEMSAALASTSINSSQFIVNPFANSVMRLHSLIMGERYV